MLTTTGAFLWLPLLAVVAHLIEEFAWPGGFPDWYRRYRPERAASLTTRFLVTINAVNVAIALLPPLMGPSPRGYAWWMMVAAIAAANGVFHLWATATRREYSPGVITGMLLYVPLAVLGVVELIPTHKVSIPTALEALIIGIGFHVWSAWNHRRRAAAARAREAH